MFCWDYFLSTKIVECLQYMKLIFEYFDKKIEYGHIIGIYLGILTMNGQLQV